MLKVQSNKRMNKHGCVTSKTSSSKILVPKTVMPSVLMTAWSLLRSGLVTFFLQSTMMVTLFLSTLRATRCHLCDEDAEVVRDATSGLKGFHTPSSPFVSVVL